MTPDLQRTARHEAGHVVAGAILGGRIIAVTLSDHGHGGAVWNRLAGGNVPSQRLDAIATACGPAAEGKLVPDGDDAVKLREAAYRIHGLAAPPDVIREEVHRAQAAAFWLVKEYSAEIDAVANLLLEFHQLVASFDRKDGLDEMLTA
jgi:hypothetical protein